MMVLTLGFAAVLVVRRRARFDGMSPPSSALCSIDEDGSGDNGGEKEARQAEMVVGEEPTGMRRADYIGAYGQWRSSVAAEPAMPELVVGRNDPGSCEAATGSERRLSGVQVMARAGHAGGGRSQACRRCRIRACSGGRVGYRLGCPGVQMGEDEQCLGPFKRWVKMSV
ncbi:hypothetical protein Dimus_029574 [Dionaea muscipula]